MALNLVNLSVGIRIALKGAHRIGTLIRAFQYNICDGKTFIRDSFHKNINKYKTFFENRL